MQFDNIETMKRAVEVHSGLAIVPETTVKREVADGSLIQVELEDVKFMRPTALIYKKGKSLSPSMKEFIRLLREGE
jgi:DNA-binding transcriptional LysR family regulator